MPSNLFNRYIWLIDIIYRNGKITLEDINHKWVKHPLLDGNTFQNKLIRKIIKSNV